jgi:hypothetical protein
VVGGFFVATAGGEGEAEEGDEGESQAEHGAAIVGQRRVLGFGEDDDGIESSDG